MADSERPVLLFSSGIDSFLARHYLINSGYDPILVYYNVRSRYSQEEMENLNKRDLSIAVDNTFSFSDIEDKGAYIPHRNLHLAMNAAGKYGKVIYIGGTMSDRVSDNNESVMSLLTTILRASLDDESVIVTSPFWGEYKCDLAKSYCDMTENGDMHLLEDTFSCYNPLRNLKRTKVHQKSGSTIVESTECNKCKACFRKSSILHHCGLFRPFKNNLIINQYRKDFIDVQVLSKNPRQQSIESYLKELNAH